MAPLMPQIARLGKVLGPRGKMPQPVPPTADLEPVIERLKRTVPVRLRNNLCINAPIGKVTLEDIELAQNANAILNQIIPKLPKHEMNIRSLHVKTTMGPSIKIERDKRK